MKVNKLGLDDFFELIYYNTEKFLHKIVASEVLVIKEFYDADMLKKLRIKVFEKGQRSEASWHALKDDCPDYHRFHDNYPKAYVKQKFHGFYHHNYYEHNKELFDTFNQIFHIKNFLVGNEPDSIMNNIPSDGVLPRINFHHYPKGGGYQAEHIDPSGEFAVIQTIIIASQKGLDFMEGGVFARKKRRGEKYYLDDYLNMGDLLILNPSIPHGVDPIDPNQEYSTNTNDGRWIIIPLFLKSDYQQKNNIKPRQL